MSSRDTEAQDLKQHIDRLLDELTVAEKAELCAGADVWRTVAIDRLGIPAIKMTDGPAGARGAAFTTHRSTGFPCGTALGATWDTDLARRLGQALAVEARAKGASILLGPTVNLHRNPLAGRNFECISEDPVLTGSLAVAYIHGVQAGGVAACIKHFVCNDAEFERHTISSDVDERPLRELYLMPFEMAVHDAGVWAVMSSYNRINGVYASEHAELVGGVLEGEWGFDGIVVSDWFGTSTTDGAAHGGLDIEMPGPGRVFGTALAEAVAEGRVDAALLDDKVRRLLRTIGRTGGFDRALEADEQSLDLPEHRALAAEMAARSLVLARNTPTPDDETPILPLELSELSELDTIALIGPNAVRAVTQGGGSSRVLNHQTITPADAISAAAGENVSVVVEPGCDAAKGVPILDRALLDGEVEVTYHPLGEPTSAPLHTERHERCSLVWFGDPPPGVGSPAFTVVVRGRLTSDGGGVAMVGVSAVGPWELAVDGDPLLDDDGAVRGGAFYGRGTVLRSAELDLDRPRGFEVRYHRSSDEPLAGLAIHATPPEDAGRFERAVDAARLADVAVVVVGTSDEWESEGFDRDGLELPGRQDELVAAIAAVNPRTVVIVNAGSPVAMPWFDQVAAVLIAWFPGMMGSTALADVLFGLRDPGGRLPTTFPRRLLDTPTILTDPGEGGHVRYGEGVFVGHRWYDSRDIEPLLPVGHGLTYGDVHYDSIRGEGRVAIPQRDGSSEEGRPTIVVTMTNPGERPFDEVVQAYVRRPVGPLHQPPLVLAGFARATVPPGVTVDIVIPIECRALRSWRTGEGWTSPTSDITIEVGRSSRDLRLSTQLPPPDPSPPTSQQ